MIMRLIAHSCLDIQTLLEKNMKKKLILIPLFFFFFYSSAYSTVTNKGVYPSAGIFVGYPMKLSLDVGLLYKIQDGNALSYGPSFSGEIGLEGTKMNFGIFMYDDYLTGGKISYSIIKAGSHSTMLNKSAEYSGIEFQGTYLYLLSFRFGQYRQTSEIKEGENDEPITTIGIGFGF